MRASILKEFGGIVPRAIVLDDDRRSRNITSLALKQRGFEVTTCKSAEEFEAVWRPGTVDVIVADWQLSNDRAKLGDRVLRNIRDRDWEVPFVLVSGKLDQDGERAGVLEDLLRNGNARFVERGTDGVRQACDDAEELIERRDVALLQLVLAMRKGALEGEEVQTTEGTKSVQEVLNAIVARPDASHNAERPIATAINARRKASPKKKGALSRLRR